MFLQWRVRHEQAHLCIANCGDRYSICVDGVCLDCGNPELIDKQIETRPEAEGPGACGGTDMITYYLRHWLIRYRIKPGLPIVLRYKWNQDRGGQDN